MRRFVTVASIKEKTIRPNPQDCWHCFILLSMKQCQQSCGLGRIVFSFMLATVTNRRMSTLKREKHKAKFWLDPVRLARERRLSQPRVGAIAAVDPRKAGPVITQSG